MAGFFALAGFVRTKTEDKNKLLPCPGGTFVKPFITDWHNIEFLYTSALQVSLFGGRDTQEQRGLDNSFRVINTERDESRDFFVFYLFLNPF